MGGRRRGSSSCREALLQVESDIPSAEGVCNHCSGGIGMDRNPKRRDTTSESLIQQALIGANNNEESPEFF